MTEDQPNVTDVLERLRAYVQRDFLYMRPDLEFKDDDSLLQKGIIDSMGVVELLEFLEEEFGVSVEDEDVTEENLGTLEAIARFVSLSQRTIGTAK